MSYGDNIFSLFNEIEKFLKENPGRTVFLAEQHPEQHPYGDYRAFSDRPNLGHRGHADRSGNEAILLDDAIGPLGLGRTIADYFMGRDQARVERYGRHEEHALYQIRK
jgi:hypothetical protein